MIKEIQESQRCIGNKGCNYEVGNIPNGGIEMSAINSRPHMNRFRILKFWAKLFEELSFLVDAFKEGEGVVADGFKEGVGAVSLNCFFWRRNFWRDACKNHLLWR